MKKEEANKKRIEQEQKDEALKQKLKEEQEELQRLRSIDLKEKIVR